MTERLPGQNLSPPPERLKDQALWGEGFLRRGGEERFCAARCLNKGKGVKDYAAAREQYQKAANSGNKKTKENLKNLDRMGC